VVNENPRLTRDVLEGAHAVVVTWPGRAYGHDEIASLRYFLRSGGGVAVLGRARRDPSTVNALLSALGSAQRLSTSRLDTFSSRLRVFGAPLLGEPELRTIIAHDAASLSTEGDRACVLPLAVAEADGETMVLAAELLGNGRLLVGGATPLTEREYDDEGLSGHQTPDFNVALIGWLTGRLQVTQGAEAAGARRTRFGRLAR